MEVHSIFLRQWRCMWRSLWSSEKRSCRVVETQVFITFIKLIILFLVKYSVDTGGYRCFSWISSSLNHLCSEFWMTTFWLEYLSNLKILSICSEKFCRLTLEELGMLPNQNLRKLQWIQHVMVWKSFDKIREIHFSLFL